ncbi:MAG: PLP-dependent transferase, partial [Deltaproteobacteria bacterium]|nr:PLP-dependent transferase [Deltaproteobacteria bacterium]
MQRKSRRDHHSFQPETLALGLGYDPALSEGALKMPVFLTSNFLFTNAEQGRRFFQAAYGLAEMPKGEAMGLIYSRLNNPNLEIYEERIAALEGMDRAALFASGMSAIATTLLALARPGDAILSTAPVYGGTHFLLEKILPPLGIEVHWTPAGDEAPAGLEQAARQYGDRVRMLYLETPANPTLSLTDIRAVADLAARLSTPDRRVLVAVDNTFLGPVFQKPRDFGADLVFYSATKFLGGHSDLVAGVTIADRATMAEVLTYRTILGTVAEPFTAWLLSRSLETLSVRMRRQAKTARILARLLAEHRHVRKVWYPGILEPGTPQAELFARQCSGPGSLIAFEIEGGEAEAFAVLDRLEVVRLAVSLGGTESLAEHPMRMTHADVPPELLGAHGVTESMIRISVGLEHVDDLKRDLVQAL